MKHINAISKESLPPELKIDVAKLGENIRTARKRRQWTIEEMAARMFVTRQTLSRLEHGDPGATLSVMVSALWVLGLEKQLFQVAAPEEDKAGIFLERKHQPERVRKHSFREKADF
jgi:transcriptional regulator with XRE-family HTH domain